MELQTQLIIATELDLGDATKRAYAESLSHEVGKMIFGLLESIKEPQV